MDHKRRTLKDVESETEHPFQAIKEEKRKSVNPSGESMPSRSKSIGMKETKDVCMKTHGSTALNENPVLFGILNMLNSQVKSKLLTGKILDAKEYLKNSIDKKVLSIGQ